MSNQHGAKLEAGDRSEEMAFCWSLGKESWKHPPRLCSGRPQPDSDLTLTLTLMDSPCCLRLS